MRSFLMDATKNFTQWVNQPTVFFIGVPDYLFDVETALT